MQDTEPKVIVSLTSIKSRIANIHRVIGSILDGSVKPHCVVLNVSASPFGIDEGVDRNDLPPSLTDLTKKDGIVINFVENTGPYRKLLPTLELFKGDERVFVTADDDCLYDTHWLENLITSYKEHGCIVSYRARLLKLDQGEIAAYRDWRPMGDRSTTVYRKLGPPNFQLVPTGNAGVAYPPTMGRDPELMRLLRPAAPFQDDLGFKAFALYHGIKSVIVPRFRYNLSEPFAKEGRIYLNVSSTGANLFRMNKEGSVTPNDIAIQELSKVLLNERNFDLKKVISAELKSLYVD